jgi:hypothetical protein
MGLKCLSLREVSILGRMLGKSLDMKLRRNSRPPLLAKGQIWKLGEGHLEITHLGKRLTEFKRYRDIAKRRAIPEMAHIEEVQTMLVHQQAALVQQARG